MDLPSAPLTSDISAPAPWTGYPAAASAQSYPSHSLLTREQLTAHLALPAAWRSLPDGRPLRLQAEGMEYILDDFGGYNASELRSAHRLLYFATRTEAEMRALWIPPVPRGDDVPESDGLALNMRALQAEISAWASATFAPDTFREVRRLALLLWNAIMERLPVSAEKKNPPATPETPASGSPTSATFAGSSPAETPPATSDSSSAPISAPSSQLSSVGAISTGIASSPCPPSPADSPPPAP